VFCAPGRASTEWIIGVEPRYEAEMLRRIGQIAINVHDLERAVAFYRDALGLPLLFRAPPDLAFFDADGVWLMLSPPEREELDHPSSILYFDVDDILAEHETLRSRGVPFHDAPHRIHAEPGRELWLATFGDSEGNLFALRGWRPAPSTP
jgi:predicted enzyme related to lactoylglutathione lyase